MERDQLIARQIFVSPLSRRNFNSSGELEDDLREQRSATIAVATCLDADFVDLNAVSRQYLQAIGRGKASRYNLIPSDFTHLNGLGSRIFGTMVGWYLTTSTAAGKDLSPFVYLDPIIVNAIVEGTDIVGA